MALDPEDNRQAVPEPSPRRPVLGVVPAYLVVLAITALVAVLVARYAAGAYHLASAAKAFPEDTRRLLAFGVLFNGAVGAGLILAFLGELLATPMRLLRGRGASRTFLRLAVAICPLLVFAIGQKVVNPWLPAVLRQVQATASQPPG